MQRQCPARSLGAPGAAAALAAALTAGLAGCGNHKATSVATPSRARWAGVNLTVACPDGPARLLVQRHGAGWARATGANLKFVPPAESATGADILVFTAPELPHWAGTGALAPVPAGDAESGDGRAGEWATFLHLYKSRLLLWDETPYALPLLGDALLCVYRDDLYRDPEAQTAYREKHHTALTSPATWDEFADQAAFFAARRGKPSLPPLPDDEDGLDRLFGAVAAPSAVQGVPEDELRRAPQSEAQTSAAHSFLYDAATGEPRVAAPGFVAALTLMRRLQPLRAPAGDRVAALNDDRAVLAVVTLRELGQLRGGGAESRWGVARVPGTRPAGAAAVNHVPYVGAGAWVGAVVKASPNAAAAFDLLTTLSGKAVSLEVVHNPEYGCGPFRDAHLSENPRGWYTYGLDEQQTAKLIEVLREFANPRVINPGVALRIPDRRQHQRALLDAVRRVVAEGADPTEALTGVATRWRELDGSPEKARAAYRRSLGLR
jgi:ABC-type glycerol-3-phosphate transport system substrate-binding protein